MQSFVPKSLRADMSFQDHGQGTNEIKMATELTLQQQQKVKTS